MSNFTKKIRKVACAIFVFLFMMFIFNVNIIYSQTIETLKGTGIAINSIGSGHENEQYAIFPLWGALSFNAWENDSQVRHLFSVGWATGKFQINGNVVAAGYSCSSDIRFKQNITPYTSALQKIMGLQGVVYDWNTEKFKDRSFSKERQIGFIAQDVEKVIPELVKTDEQGYKSMDYSRLSVVLVEAFKEQKRLSDAKISALEKENASLKLRLASLEKMGDRVARLENMMKQQKAVLAAR